MKKTIMILASITGISFLLATPTMQSKAATTTTQSERSPRIDETNNVTITDFDDTVKNSDAAYQYNISTNDTHSMGIKISSKSALGDFDLSQLTLEASWSGSSSSDVVPLPDWIKVSGIQNVAYSADHKTVTFDLIFSIDQERLIAALGSLDNIRMLTIRIATNFGGSIANNAGTITFEIITAGSQPSETTDTTTGSGSTEPSDSTTPSGSSTTPSDSTTPSESTGPSSSSEPSGSSEPSDSTTPSGSSTTPSESTGPSSSSEPSESTESSSTTTPSESTGPSSSNEPSEPTETSSTTTPSGSTESSESSTLPEMDESSSALKTTETSDSSPSNSETTKKNPLSRRVSEDSSDSSHINTHVANSTTKYGSYPKTGAVQHPLVAAFGFLLIGLALVIKKK